MKRIFAAGTLLAMLIGLLLVWRRAPREIEPAGPNPFVQKVIIEPIEKDAVAFGETIHIPATHGVYAKVTLERFEELPPVIEEREVSLPHRWPITFAIYRLGHLDGPEAREYTCLVPGDFVEDPKRSPIGGGQPPPYLPRIGTRQGWRRAVGFQGEPDLPARRPDKNENVYWTFLTVPDQNEPAGEYVYEVRLYPTARWISSIRFEKGPPIVLQRGLLLAADEPAAAVAAR